MLCSGVVTCFALTHDSPLGPHAALPPAELPQCGCGAGEGTPFWQTPTSPHCSSRLILAASGQPQAMMSCAATESNPPASFSPNKTHSRRLSSVMQAGLSSVGKVSPSPPRRPWGPDPSSFPPSTAPLKPAPGGMRRGSGWIPGLQGC